jgi:hypothetical protein
MDKENKVIHYNFFHWGPFLYKATITLTEEEIDSNKKIV